MNQAVRSTVPLSAMCIPDIVSAAAEPEPSHSQCLTVSVVGGREKGGFLGWGSSSGWTVETTEGSTGLPNWQAN